MARAVVIVCAALALLVIVLLLNTLRFTRERGSVPPAPSVALDRAAAADRLAEAIRFETVSRQDPGSRDRQAFRDFHAFLARRFPGVHRALEREVVNGESLLYTWPGTERRAKPILLVAHQDVVPVEPGTESRWSQPPFSGRIADGFVWGRGAMDQKVSVLGILEAVESLVAQGVEPARTVYLAFGHDEELGGTDGAAQIAALLKSRNVRLDYVLDEGLMIGEGLIPGVRPPIAMVGIAEKGRLTLELRATARGGHASMPPPQTAIGVLAAALAKLEANPMPATVGGAARGLREPLAHRVAREAHAREVAADERPCPHDRSGHGGSGRHQGEHTPRRSEGSCQLPHPARRQHPSGARVRASDYRRPENQRDPGPRYRAEPGLEDECGELPDPGHHDPPGLP